MDDPIDSIMKFVMWHSEAGVTVSPFCNELPLTIGAPSSLEFKDLTLPRLLPDNRIHLAFYPLIPISNEGLFHPLGKTTSQLSRLIVVNERAQSCALPDDVIENWTQLETALIDVSQTLLERHPHRSQIPVLQYPSTPHRYGYRDSHPTHEQALACARRSQQAFVMLSAVVAFAFSIWNKFPCDSSHLKAFEILEEHMKVRPPPLWFDWLRESIVCNVTPGSRVGAFLDPYDTLWFPFLHCFVGAGVPVWFMWGKTCDRLRICDKRMFKLIPPANLVQAAQNKVLNYLEIILPHEHLHVPKASSSQFSTADAPNPRAQLYVEAGSLQKNGETWEEFFERVDNEARRVKPRGSQLQSLVDLGDSSESGPTNECSIYLWVPDEVDPAFYRRSLLEGSSRNQWHSFHSSQKQFWPHLNQWDLCPQIHVNDSIHPRPDAESRDLNQDPQGEASNEGLHTQDAPTDEASYERPQMHSDLAFPIPVETSQKLLESSMDRSKVHFSQRSHSVSAGLTISSTFSVLEYLYKRHGLRFEMVNHDVQVVAREAKNIYKDLVYEQPAVNDSHLDQILHFFRLNLTSDNLSRDALPPAWDISPRCQISPELSSPSKFRLLHAAAERVPSEGRAALFIIQPCDDSPDSSSWFIATTSATAVLLAYRSPWKTMQEVAKGFLSYGIPFNTVVPFQPVKFEKLKAQRLTQRRQPQTVSLGRRLDRFSPRAYDFEWYQSARDALFASKHGRALCMVGGLVGRMARQVVSPDAILRGPIRFDKIVGRRHSLLFVDDDITDEMLNLASGVYAIKNKTGSVADMSWWPKHSVWQTSGLAGDQWLPGAESWYIKRQAELTGPQPKLDIFNSSKWKTKIKFSKYGSQKLLTASKRMSTEFLVDSQLGER